MIDNVKRAFLMTSIASTSLPLWAAFSANKDQCVSASSNRVDELIYVYKFWKQEKSMEPDDYLKFRGVNLLDAKQLKLLSVQDFNQGNTLDVRGYILSEAEVAFMASLGKSHL
tara:strand:+ start:1662 stop:2000 length:339 start_codon:yes stop_codon:yes gene_type:complete